MLSPKIKRLFKKMSIHLSLWYLAGLLYILLEKGIMGESILYPSTGNIYDFRSSLISILLVALMGGSIFGFLEELVFKNLFIQKAFIVKLLFKTSLYVSVLTIILFFNSAISTSLILNLPVHHPDVLSSSLTFFANFVFISIVIYASFFMCLSIFLSDIFDYVGTHVLSNFFTGTYSRSKKEIRVFMFLDMKSSTSIAESLGHEKYYHLLNSYYRDMTDSILNAKGEIYQYIGDEIVVSWKLRKDIQNDHCINCYYSILAKLNSRQEFYIDTFGVMPEFKAGLHYGNITTGEVGLIKKEILFTGDVLNTTARIQGLCNELNASLLISDDLKKTLSPLYNYELKGEFELRGRGQNIQLFSVSVE